MFTEANARTLDKLRRENNAHYRRGKSKEFTRVEDNWIRMLYCKKYSVRRIAWLIGRSLGDVNKRMSGININK